MTNKIILRLLAIFTLSVLASCSKTSQTEELKNSMGSPILRDNGAVPVIIDAEKREVIIEAEVNGKYFNSPTRHGVVFKGGSNGDKSVLRGLCDEREFYQALVDIGAKPGNNLTFEDMKLGKTVGGNFENAKSKRTGCILCLDSCAVGIVSDAAYETGAVEMKKIDRFGREDILPKDGTKVLVIFRISSNN